MLSGFGACRWPDAAETARRAVIGVAAWPARAEALAGTFCRAFCASGPFAAFSPPGTILTRETRFEGALAVILSAPGALEALPCRTIAGSRRIAEPAGAAVAARRLEAAALETACTRWPFAIVAGWATAPFTRARTSAVKATGASALPSGAATATRFARSTRSASVVVVAHDRVTLSAVLVKAGQVGVWFGLVVRRA